ncbi:MAG: cytochrome c oxidase subunit II [Acidobacteriota bacterium]
MLENMPLFPEQASTIAHEVDALYLVAVGISVFFSVLIFAAAIAFALKFKRKSEDHVGTPEKSSLALEITWSVIPLIIALGLFAWGTKVFIHASKPPADAVEYFAVGKQWMWKFQHPNGYREINDFHVPAGVPIKVTVTSEDVIHDLFFPSFRVKTDAVPGRYNTVWFEATKPGKYHLFCAEYCGAEHSRMIGSIYVMEANEYEQWLDDRPSAGKPSVASGQQLFENLACATCHRFDSGPRGPALRDLEGSEVRLADGSKIKRSDTYLREAILNPGAKIVAGFDALMPPYQGQLSEEQLLTLIQYIKTIDQSSPQGVVADSVETDEASPEEVTAEAEAVTASGGPAAATGEDSSIEEIQG